MKIQDCVFGEQVITEPVVLDLILAPSLQRLRGVDQSGYPEPFFPTARRHTRFNHSLGVYFLLRRYKASLEEQIAGLIHDVSHTAFSHCADYTLGNVNAGKTQSHQDDVFASFVRASEIPQILARHKISVDRILDDSLFPLKEKPLPDLCADRLDYSLRCAIMYNICTADEIDHLLKTLHTDGTTWFFETPECAQAYATLFSRLNADYWAGMGSALMFSTVGDCLRYAQEQGYLSSKDLYATDEEVLNKIRSHLDEDPRLQRLFDRMNNRYPVVEDKDRYEAVVYCKSRIVDPPCRHNDSLTRLSEVDPSWTVVVERESVPKAYFLRFGDKAST